MLSTGVGGTGEGSGMLLVVHPLEFLFLTIVHRTLLSVFLSLATLHMVCDRLPFLNGCK